jgi:hypothetical protein
MKSLTPRRKSQRDFKPIARLPWPLFLCALCVLCGLILRGPEKFSHKGHKEHKGKRTDEVDAEIIRVIRDFSFV